MQLCGALTFFRTSLGLKGQLKIKVIKRMRYFRLPWYLGHLVWIHPKEQALIPGNVFFMTSLHADVYRNDEHIESRDLGSGVVTNAGVNLMSADWTNATATLKAMNWHQSGTSSTAPAVTDTALGAAITGNVTSGVQSNATNVYTTIATLAYSAVATVTEWGLFNASTGSGTASMWDHRTFAGIAVDSTTSIKFTYNLTINSGG